MGRLYEMVSTPVAYLTPSYYAAHPPLGIDTPHVFSYGSSRQQHCVLWEPEAVAHDACVLYFHGGGYVFGRAESLADVAACYLSQGYRFCSVGYRTAPAHRFPVQVADAFLGAKSALAWLEAHGRPARRVVVGGTSAGGQLAALLSYSPALARTFGFSQDRVRACVSVAGVADAADLLLDPFATQAFWNLMVELPTYERSRAARVRAIARYSPLAIIEGEPEVPRVPLFVVHGRSDTLSPYASQQRLVSLLGSLISEDKVRLHTLEGTRWQHMLTCVTLHRRRVEESEALSTLFSWLEETLAEDVQ